MSTTASCRPLSHRLRRRIRRMAVPDQAHALHAHPVGTRPSEAPRASAPAWADLPEAAPGAAEARLVNLTPHPVTVVLPSGRRVTIAASGRVARVEEPAGKEGRLATLGESIPLVEAPLHGHLAGLPPSLPGTYLIVSSRVAMACPGRVDVLAPGTGPDDGAERDAAGRIVAVRRLRRYAR